MNQYFSYSPHFKQPPKPSSDHAFEVELGRKIIEWLVNIDLIPWPLSNTALLFDHITGVSIGKIMWMSWNLYPHKDNAAVADSATNLEEEFETTKELETQKTELDLFQKCVFDVVLKEGSEISPYLTTLLIEEIKDQ